MSYSIFSSTSPAMPKPTKGTEIVKLLLSQASKDMREPLLPMVMPAFVAHLSDVELMYSDNKYHELCGQMGHLIGPSDIGKDQLHDLVEAICAHFVPTMRLSTRNWRTGNIRLCRREKRLFRPPLTPPNLGGETGTHGRRCTEVGRKSVMDFSPRYFGGFVEKIGQLAERAGEWIKLWGR